MPEVGKWKKEHLVGFSFLHLKCTVVYSNVLIIQASVFEFVVIHNSFDLYHLLLRVFTMAPTLVGPWSSRHPVARSPLK